MSNKENDPVRAMLRQEQNWRLRDLREGSERLIKEANRLIKKVEAEGYDGYYSINSDVLGVARKVHVACNDLWRLRVLNEKLDNVKKNTPENVRCEPESAAPKKPQTKSKRRKKKS